MKDPNADWPTMQFADPLTGASRWFAWYPVCTWDHRWRWLCWVERRLMQLKPHLHDYARSTPWWQYRLKVSA